VLLLLLSGGAALWAGGQMTTARLRMIALALMMADVT